MTSDKKYQKPTNTSINSLSGDLDIIDLFSKIYKEKIIVVLITLLGTLISTPIIFYSKTKYDGILQVRALSPIFNSKFSSYNSLNNIINQERLELSGLLSEKNKQENNSLEFQKLNSSFFFIEFFEALSDKKVIKDTIFNIIKTKENFEITDSELHSMSWDLANGFVIDREPLTVNDMINRLSFNLKFQTTNKLESKKIIESTFSKINSDIKYRTLEMIKNSSEVYQLDKERTISQLQIKLNNVNEIKKDLLKKNIQFLERHYEIAKNLNINNNLFDKQFPNLNDEKIKDFGNNLLLELNYFQKGKKIIRNQIDILTEKMKNSVKQKNFPKLENKIKQLTQENYKALFAKVVKNLPFDQYFSAVNYQINDIKYIDISKKIRSLTISIILSFLLSLILALVFNLYRLKKSI